MEFFFERIKVFFRMSVSSAKRAWQLKKESRRSGRVGNVIPFNRLDPRVDRRRAFGNSDREEKESRGLSGQRRKRAERRRERERKSLKWTSNDM